MRVIETGPDALSPGKSTLAIQFHGELCSISDVQFNDP
jgi:hypothetical protein